MARQFYIPDEQRLANTLQQQARSLADVQRPTGTEREQTLLKLQAALEELQARASKRVTTSDLSVKAVDPGTGAGGTVIWANGQRDFSLPASTGSRRIAGVSVSGGLHSANTGNSMPMVFLLLLHGGQTVGSASYALPLTTGYYPPGWSSRFTMPVNLVLPSTATTLTLRAYVSTYPQGGTTTIDLTDLTASVTYGEQI